jgi:DNA-binding CsgD family transcriptional regulator
MQFETTILDVVNLTPDDLDANQHGQLSHHQQQFLKKHRYKWAAGTLSFFVTLATLIVALTLKIRFPSFASRGEFFIGVPIGLFWLWLFHTSPLRWFQTNQELREGNVATVEGQVQCEITGNVGLIQVPHFLIRIAGHGFRVNKYTYFQFKNREYYQVFYTPFSKTLLGAIQIPVPSQIYVKTHYQANPDFILVEPLTSQEREILQHIASGLSNKEIASELALSTNTVKMYTSKLYRKLGVRRRTEAIARARQLNIL